MDTRRFFQRSFAGVIAFVVSPALFTACEHEKTAERLTGVKLEVLSVCTQQSFFTYVGGGTSIPEPPMGGSPAMFGAEGSMFTAAETSADPNSSLVKVTLAIENTSAESQAFKVGNFDLAFGQGKKGGIYAVGNGNTLHVKPQKDLEALMKMRVTIPPGDRRIMSYLFMIEKGYSGNATIAMLGVTPATLTIPSETTK